MRRPLVSLAFLPAVTALWLLATAGPATAAPSARMVCPQQRPQIVPCCPVPIGPAPSSADVMPICCPTTCCTPTPCPPGNLTIASSPDPSTAGRQVVISGLLSTSPAGGAHVALWRERAEQSSFQQIAQTTTDSSGHYTFTLKPGTVMADQAFYVTSGALRSTTLDQTVRALVGLVGSAHSTLAGQPVVLHGHVTPSHAGETVLIEQSHAGRWRVIARARLSKRSNYALSRRFIQSGRTKLRAVLRGDARNIQSISPVLALNVKP
jgi:hypothetical protein